MRRFIRPVVRPSVSPLLLFFVNIALGAHPDATRPAMPGRLVDAGGYQVHLYCTGTGSPTVLFVGGGFSVDWGLVQPEVAKFTRICTYDPAGTAWSEDSKSPHSVTCTDRVRELQAAMKSADIPGPYLLVGFSIGGLIARLYANQHPEQVAAMVLVDHTFVDTEDPPPQAPTSGVDSLPILISKTPIALDIADDENFKKLPERDQKAHRWALSIGSPRPSVEMAKGCFSEVDALETGAYPLGTKPLAVISTSYDSPRYAALQSRLLKLSRTSRQYQANNSSHMVIIDQPEIIVQAIRDTVAAIP